MVYTEGAKVISPEELKAIIDEPVQGNPTIERMMFIEARDASGNNKIFPCYVEAYGEEENAAVKVDPGLRFQICIVQSIGGEFSMVRVIVMANELGVTKRIWDKPPTKGLREELPFAVIADDAPIQ